MPEKYEGNGATKICQDHEHLRNFALSRSASEQKTADRQSASIHGTASVSPNRVQADRPTRYECDQITVAAKKKRKKPMLLLRKSKSLSIT